MMRRSLICVLLLQSVAGCAVAPVNPELSKVDHVTGYRWETLEPAPNNSDKTFVIVAISGGGIRAAALAYGTLSEMARVRYGTDQRSLLDEVDVLSTVSASSLVSAYYAIFGQERFLSDFDDDVLELNIAGAYGWRLANPLNWFRVGSIWFSRTDLLAEYLDENVFENSRFQNLSRQRPFIIIGAMDLALGAQFIFDQDHFDRLCSDLDGVKVAQAVASSMAVPPYFAPIRLNNYEKYTCGYETPMWVVANSEAREKAGTRQATEAQTWREYEDAENRPFVHLVDGAFGDRLAIRPVERALSSSHSPWSIQRMVNSAEISRIVVISIDASVPGARSSFPSEPSFFLATTAASRRASEIYTADVSELLRLALSSWQLDSDEAKGWSRQMTARCNALALEICRDSQRSVDADRQHCEINAATACYDQFSASDLFPVRPEVYSINVRLEDLVDEEERNWASRIPTGLYLPPEDTKKLAEVGSRLISASPSYQRLVQRLKMGSESQ